MSISRQDQHQARKESHLRQEISDLQMRLQEAEQRNQEQWDLMQKGDITAVLGIGGVIFDGGTDHSNDINALRLLHIVSTII